jgi:hypothetical protein
MVDPFSAAGRFEERRRDAAQARALEAMEKTRSARIEELTKLIRTKEEQKKRLEEEIDTLREERWSLKRKR